MLFLPPGSAKSTYASVLFPAWYLGRNQAKSIIGASHSGELAERFGRKVRNIVAQSEYTNIFDTTMSQDSAAAGRWETTNGSEYYAVGVGGSVTGRRADLGIIDDPVKSREEADSETQREKVWEWYKADFFTRLKPNSSVILIMCMTGDTQVLMADGTEKSLKHIRVKDTIATYKDGQLSTSIVRNWAKQGIDFIYEIKMKSGVIVKANERHPFLVERDGGHEWIKLRNLKVGDRLLTASNGGSGTELLAKPVNVTSLQNARDIAIPITIKPCGQAATGHRQLIQNQDELLASNIDTELTRKPIKRRLKNRMGIAPFAGSHQPQTYAPIGVENCALTTTMTQEKCEDCSATIAILQSDMAKQSKYCCLPLNTYKITHDEIIGINEAGRDIVYDIQVDDTENFIANGLISHNTRWHEDDLAGRLLQDAKEGGEQWEVLSLSMEAGETDPLGRTEGELLWPEWFTEDMIKQAKRDPRNWLALYQQQPRPDSGGEFKKEWIQHYKNKPTTGNKYILVDPASEKKKTSDYTAIFVILLGHDNNYYIIDIIRDKLNLTERANLVFKLHREHKPLQVAYEKYGMQADIEHLKDRMERESYRFHVEEVGGAMPKNDRIRRMVALFEAKRIWMPETLHKTDFQGNSRDLVQDFIEQEYAAFPVGKHDDMMDCLARLHDIYTTWPKEAENKEHANIDLPSVWM